MPSLLSPRRTDPDLALHATVARTERTVPTVTDPPLPPASGLLAAVGGALATALIGWIVVVGLCVLAWLTAAPGSFPGALTVGTQLWLLANGAGAHLGTSTLTLVPYGLTALFALVLSGCASFAGRHAAAGPEGTPPTTGRTWLTLTAAMVLTYAAVVAAVKLSLGSPGLSLSSALGAATVVVLAVGCGSAQGLRYRPTAAWSPAWRAVARAVLGAQLVLVVAGAAALTTGLVRNLERVTELTAGLGAGLGGGLLLLLAQVALLPNAVLWSSSYVLGAGFHLGSGSLVAPVSTQLAVLPSVPLLGSVPEPATGGVSALWWLVAGVLAGALAGWLALRNRPAVRRDVAILVGGLAGAAGGLVFVALAWMSGGDLGTLRLAGLGPRLLPLLVLSVSTLGLAGSLSGLATCLVRRALGRRALRAGGADAAPSAGTAG